DGVVRMDDDLDRVAIARQRLVHRVVHNLVDEVVQPANSGRADVHARTLPDGLEAFEDRDVLGVVARSLLSVRWVAGAQWSPSSHAHDAPAGRRSSTAGAWSFVAMNISSRGFRIRTRARSKGPANAQVLRPCRAGSQALDRRLAENLVQASGDDLGH